MTPGHVHRHDPGRLGAVFVDELFDEVDAALTFQRRRQQPTADAVRRRSVVRLFKRRLEVVERRVTTVQTETVAVNSFNHGQTLADRTSLGPSFQL